MNEKQKKIAGAFVFAALGLFFLGVTVFLGKPLLSLVEDPEVFRAWVEEKGWVARLIFIGMVTVQVIVALIPGEPLEIGAGIAFGSVEGTLLCLVGITVGSAIVFFLVRKLGVRLVEVFFSMEKIHSLRILQNERRLEKILFLLMMIPGTPKDLICYFIGLTEMKLGTWLVMTFFARIPSVVTSTVGGDALGEKNYIFAFILFAVTAAVSVGGAILFDRISNRRKKGIKERSVGLPS